jgi:hypothetical protein
MLSILESGRFEEFVLPDELRDVDREQEVTLELLDPFLFVNGKRFDPS